MADLTPGTPAGPKEAEPLPTGEGPPDASASAATTAKQVRGSSVLLAGRLLSLTINFAVQVLIVRYLSRTDYGAFAYVLSLVAFGEAIVTLGLDRGITRFLAIYDERGEREKLGGTLLMTIATIASLSVALVLLVFGLRGWISGSLVDDPTVATLLLIMVFLAPLQALDTLVIGVFAVFDRARAIFWRKYVLAPLLRLGVVLLLVLGGQSVSFLAAGYVIAGAVGVVIYGGYLVRLLRERGFLAFVRPSRATVPYREVLGFCLPLLTVDLVYVVLNTSDAVLVGYFAGTVDVAAMRAVLPAARLNQLVMQSFQVLFMPTASRVFARDDSEGVNDLYWQTAVWIAVMTFPVFAVTFALADPVTVTLFGDRYRDAGTFMAVLAFGYYFQAALGFNGLTLRVFGKVRAVVLLSVASAVVNIVLNLALIPPFGALGAVMGTAGTLVVFNLLKQLAMRRGTGIPMMQRQYVGIYALIAVAAGALFAFQALVEPGIVLGGLAAAVVSAGVLWFSRDTLRVADTFPELARLPILRRVLS